MKDRWPMQFEETPIPGAYVITLERKEDDRGYFSRCFCAEEFGALGLATQYVQNNLSYNRRRGTLRGMHFQAAPKAEAKIVWCIAGRIYDVIVDLRPESPSRGRWFGVELNDESRRALYVPKGVAHGFQTLSDGACVFYWMSEYYSADHSAGVRWNDRAFGIKWPLEPVSLSDRDARYPDFAL